jgi:hypothetical protein
MANANYDVSSPSKGKRDVYTVGQVLIIGKSAEYGVVVKAWKALDDSDEWRKWATVRPATEAEAAPLKARAAAKLNAQTLADALHKTHIPGEGMNDPRVMELPSGAVTVWMVRQEIWGHARYVAKPDGKVYFVQSDSENGPAVWETTATVKQVEEAKAAAAAEAASN